MKRYLKKGFLLYLVCFLIMFLHSKEVFAAKTIDATEVVEYFENMVGKSWAKSQCLNFVRTCFQDLGGDLSSTCCAYNYGVKHIQSTDINSIPLGADVFFGTCGGGPCATCGASYYGHIGVYIGDGYFVHATGGKVQKSTINSWKSHWRGWGDHGGITIKRNTEYPASSRTILEGDYYIVSAVDNQFSLDIPGRTAEVGTSACIFTRTERDEQIFHVELKSDGYYRITHKDSGLMLDASGGETTAGTNVQLYTKNGYPAQDWVIEESGDGQNYYIRQRKSGLCLDVQDGKAEDRTNVRLWTPNGAKAQKWFFRTAGRPLGQTIPDGDYIIASDLNQSKVITADVTNNATSNGTNAHLWERSDGNNQIFTFKYQGEGYYKIIEKKTGYILDAANWQLARGGNVQMWEQYNGNEAGLWIVKKNGDAYNIINKYTGLYLNSKGVTAEDGTNVMMWSMHTGGAEKWHLLPIACGSEMQEGFGRKIPDGDYAILNAADRNYFLDILGGDLPASNATNVSLWNRNSSGGVIGENNIWTVTYQDGFYSLKQKGTSMALDSVYGGLKDKTNVQVYTSNSLSCQKWAITESAAGTGYSLYSKASGYLLTAENGVMADKTNVLLHAKDGTNSQSWVFIPYKSQKTIAPGKYYISSAINNDQVFTVGGWGTDNKSNVQLWSNFHTGFVFDIQQDSEGFYYIKYNYQNCNKILDCGGLFSDGANVYIYDDGSNPWQRFTIHDAGGGYYYIIDKNSRKALDAAGGVAQNGTNIQLYRWKSGEPAQKWKFIPAEYEVKYDANGGSGAPEKQTKNYRNNLTLSSKMPSRQGYVFAGWSSNKNADTGEYQAGATFTGNENTTLYAIWKLDIPSGTEMSSGYNRYLPDGDYQILCAGRQDYMLDIAGNDVPAPNGKNIRIWEVGSAIREQDIFTLRYTDGFYRLTQKGTSMSLDVQDVSALNNSNVQVWENNDNASQKWAINLDSTRLGYSLQAKCSGYKLTVDSDENVVQRMDEGNSSQAWVFVPYMPEHTLPDGRYMLVSALNPSLILDVSGDSGNVSNGQNVQVWHDYADNQYNCFDVKYIGEGYYKLIHAASGKVLTVENGGSTFDQNICLWDDQNSYAQQWAITSESDGFLLRSRCNGYAMDVVKGRTEDGTNVHSWSYTATPNQSWSFVPAEYQVAYSGDEGIDVPDVQIKYYGNALKLSELHPERTGYSFLGWATEQGSEVIAYQPGDLYEKDESIQLYPVWEKTVLRVSFSTGTEEVTVDPMNVVFGNEVGTLPTAERSGHILDGWFTLPAGGERITEDTTFEKDVTVFAHWEKETYVIGFDTNTELKDEEAFYLEMVYGNEYGDMPEPERDGFIFDGWYTAADGGEEIVYDTVVSDLSTQQRLVISVDGESIECVQILYAHWIADEEYEPSEPGDHVHVEVRVNVKEASCTEDGYTGDLVCEECGDVLETGEVVPAAGHDWDEGTITLEATCRELGVKLFTCSVCGETKEEEILVEGHTGNVVIKFAKEATCTEAGYSGDQYCDECGELIEEGEELPAAGHSWNEGKTEKEATCTEDGLISFTCRICGESRAETVPATGHGEPIVKFIKKATCTKPGYSGDTFCSVCGEMIEEGSEISPTGHQWEENEVLKSVSCIEDGKSKFVCSICGEEKEEQVPAAGHVPVTKIMKEATCMEEGYSGDIFCDVCGELIEEGEVLPKTDHMWDEGTVTKQATCTENGEKLFTCIHNPEHAKMEELPAIGHRFGDWTIVKEATSEEEGIEQRVCENDASHIETRTIEKLPKPEETSENLNESEAQESGKDPEENIPQETEKGTEETKTQEPEKKQGETIPQETEKKTEVVPEQKPTVTPAKQEDVVTPETEADIASAPSEKEQERSILSEKNDKDPKHSNFGLLQARAVKVTSNSITVKWRRVKGATKYIVYGNKCGKGIQVKKLKTVKGTSFTQKKLKKGTYYKYLIVAVGSGKAITTSKMIHVVTSGGRYRNAVKVTVRKAKIQLKKGKTFNLGAKEVINGLAKKHRKVAYESTNTNIARVSKTGKIKALRKGTCYVYAYAQNGLSKKVKVVVK